MKRRAGSAIDWVAIKNEFVTGHMQLKDLADKHKIKDATVRQRSNRENWSHERHLLSLAVTEEVVKTAAEEKIEILSKWNKETIEEAKMLRLAARTLYMEKGEDGKYKIKRGLSGADLNAVHNTNTAADRLVRLATDSATDISTVTNKQLPASIDEFV